MNNVEKSEILLVEDDPKDAQLTTRVLIKNNIVTSVHLVTDGEEALDFLFSRGAFSDKEFSGFLRLILLDLKLPKINGLEVLKQIKENDKTKSIPVVILTSSALDQDMEEAYRLGANSYIQKPVGYKEFHETVKRVGLYWMVVNQYYNT